MDNIYIHIPALRRISPAKKLKSAEKNKGSYAVQGHSRSSHVIDIGNDRKPYATSYILVINSN